MENASLFFLYENPTAYGLGPFYYDQDQPQFAGSFTEYLPASYRSLNVPRSAGDGYGGYSPTNVFSMPHNQGGVVTHGRVDYAAWQQELASGVPQNSAPPIKPSKFPDKQCRLPSAPPPQLPIVSISLTSNSTRVVGSEALHEFAKNRRKRPAVFKCDFTNCNRDFTTRANQEHHKNSHLGIKKYHCDRCGKAFGVGHSKKRHLKTCVKNILKQHSNFK